MKKHNIVYMPGFIKQTFIFLVLLFFVDNLVVMRGEIVDISENTSINQSINKTNYWLIVVVLLSTACSLLLVVIDVKYFMRTRSTILYLLSY